MCTLASSSVTCGSGNAVTVLPNESGVIRITLPLDNNFDLLTQAETIENHVDIATSSPETNISDNHDEHDAPVIAGSGSNIFGTVFEDDGNHVIGNTDAINGTQETGEAPIEDVAIFLAGVDIYGGVT